VKKPPPPVRKLGGKKVVLEYDNAAANAKKAPVAVAAKDDSAAIGAARTTYFNGNRKLFAGDANAAIKLYQQALAVYPGYVAGYRGLGLAYAQKGDKPNALKAFRTYVAAVPAAKDVGLIRQRIATLQKK
jgi:tetratricopeptide (TPR) repeat protein